MSRHGFLEGGGEDGQKGACLGMGSRGGGEGRMYRHRLMGASKHMSRYGFPSRGCREGCMSRQEFFNR